MENDTIVTCKDVSTLVAASRLDDLPLTLKLRIGLHLAMCRYCRRFYRQIRAIDDGMRAALETMRGEMPADLADRVRTRISPKP